MFQINTIQFRSLPLVNGVTTPASRVITPATHFKGHLQAPHITLLIFENRAHLVDIDFFFLVTLPETSSSPLNINGWKMMHFLLGPSACFLLLVSGRVVILDFNQIQKHTSKTPPSIPTNTLAGIGFRYWHENKIPGSFPWGLTPWEVWTH